MKPVRQAVLPASLDAISPGQGVKTRFSAVGEDRSRLTHFDAQNAHIVLPLWVVQSEPWALGHGEKIVRLVGYRGGFAIECLKRVGDIDHKYTENIVCPYCGYEDTDSFEWERDAIEVNNVAVECDECGKKFKCSRQFEITYTTRKHEVKDE